MKKVVNVWKLAFPLFKVNAAEKSELQALLKLYNETNLCLKSSFYVESFWTSSRYKAAITLNRKINEALACRSLDCVLKVVDPKLGFYLRLVWLIKLINYN